MRPFHFLSERHLVQLTGERATSLSELLRLLREVDGSSIFHHTHQSFLRQHFIIPNYHNDFAYWVEQTLEEDALAERLASCDLRDFPSVRSLRERMIAMIEDHLAARGQGRQVSPEEAFYFAQTHSVILPTPHRAADLREFRSCLEHVSVNSLFYHFFVARLRLGQPRNDFSRWLAEEGGRPRLAEAIEALDPYVVSLEGLRQQVIALVDEELGRG